jgi:hypothetical protein
MVAQETLPALSPGAAPPQVTLMHIIERAANAPDFDVERLTKLLELKERWEASEAKNEYYAAMAAFKRSPPRIQQNKHVKFQTARGWTEYDHATHAEVVGKITESLAANGITHAWRVAQSDAGTSIEVTCTLTHVRGFAESVAIRAHADESGGKNSIQAIASAITYLERYTLLAITGLSGGDSMQPDTDERVIKTDVPDVPVDAWVSLRDAAKESNDALAGAWRALSKETRQIINLHHNDEWTALKAAAEKLEKK